MIAKETMAPGQPLIGFISHMLDWLQRIAWAVAPLALRVALAIPFYLSGLTKWKAFLSLSPTAVFLFEENFKLHIFGGLYDLPAPALMAWFDGVAEITLPIFLILGFATRLSSLALLGMIGVIQLVVPDGWLSYHLPWSAMALSLIALGPGPISVDWIIRRVFGVQAPKKILSRPH